MKTEELIKKMKDFNKSYYTSRDMAALTGQSKKSVLVNLNRLVKAGKLKRLRKDCYLPVGRTVDYELIAQQLDQTSYVSFESALSSYGVLNQVPYSLTMATASRSKQIKLGDRTVIYRRLKKDLMFGYIINNKIKTAEPEKALLDLLYLASRGQGEFNYNEIDLRNLEKRRLKKMAQRFPRYTGKMLSRLLRAA